MSDIKNAPEYLGLSLPAAHDLAARRAVRIRNRSFRVPATEGVVAFTDDLRSDRVNIWLDDDGNVIRAEIF